MKVDLKPYLPADGIILSGDRSRAEQANFNQSAGPAFTLFLDGAMVAAGGVRLSVGEAWFILSGYLREQLNHVNYRPEKRQILRTCQQMLEQMTRDEGLYRLYAEARIAEGFCEALGFEKKDNIYVR